MSRRGSCGTSGAVSGRVVGLYEVVAEQPSWFILVAVSVGGIAGGLSS